MISRGTLRSVVVIAVLAGLSFACASLLPDQLRRWGTGGFAALAVLAAGTGHAGSILRRSLAVLGAFATAVLVVVFVEDALGAAYSRGRALFESPLVPAFITLTFGLIAISDQRRRGAPPSRAPEAPG